jgi:hypothetical protein
MYTWSRGPHLLAQIGVNTTGHEARLMPFSGKETFLFVIR